MFFVLRDYQLHKPNASLVNKGISQRYWGVRVLVGLVCLYIVSQAMGSDNFTGDSAALGELIAELRPVPLLKNIVILDCAKNIDWIRASVADNERWHGHGQFPSVFWSKDKIDPVVLVIKFRDLVQVESSSCDCAGDKGCRFAGIFHQNIEGQICSLKHKAVVHYLWVNPCSFVEFGGLPHFIQLPLKRGGLAMHFGQLPNQNTQLTKGDNKPDNHESETGDFQKELLMGLEVLASFCCLAAFCYGWWKIRFYSSNKPIVVWVFVVICGFIGAIVFGLIALLSIAAIVLRF
ncbi:MAG TPA: hypothetical protein VGY56_18050 [Verrucomicrobiae bacterium]|nr:hypothetical protein [Verrucomicrobiae bacterium]